MELPIYSRALYLSFIFIGFVLLIIVNCLRRKRYGFSIFTVIIISILVEIFSVLGAYILYCLENPKYIKYFGVSFFGTVIFLPLFLYLFSLLYKKISYSKLMNFVAVTIPLELAFIRIGCTLCGCCYGIIFPFGIHYGKAIRFPVQPMESMLDITIFIFLLINEKKEKFKYNNYVLFLFLYSIVRLFCEFFRGDKVVRVLFLTNGQFFSICGILISLILFYISKRKKHNNLRKRN